MHQQIRSSPRKSPADLKEFLEVVKDAGFNILAAGGSDVEKGGEFAFAVADGQEKDALKALHDAGYRQARIVDVDHFFMTDNPGQLLACVVKVARKNASSGKAIKDLAVGVPNDKGEIPVQIYSE